MKRTVRTLSVFFAILIFLSSLAGTSAAGNFTTEEEWAANFQNMKGNNSVIALTPGTDESEMRFAWLSSPIDFAPKFKLGRKADLSDAKTIAVKNEPTVIGLLSNKVTAENLKPNTVYYYSYTVKGMWSKTESFKTGTGTEFKAIFMSDPQIGRSGDGKLDRVLSRDSYGWNSALESALATHPDTGFLLCGGDLVNTGTRKAQYNLLLAPKTLRSLPFATAMGNHDFYFPLYSDHFNNPNVFKGSPLLAPGGNGYWFRRGQALFVVLDSNFPIPGSQETLLKEAAEANPDALWRIVMMHHSIYGSYQGDDGPANLWRGYYAIFDKFNVDLVLSGHDHVYCRSYPMRDNKMTADGKGTVYLSANSASGSKYSPEPENTPWYAATCHQLRVPSYTVLEFTQGKLKLNTYRTDTSEKVDDEYVMTKTSPVPLPEAESLIDAVISFFRVLIVVIQSTF